MSSESTLPVNATNVATPAPAVSVAAPVPAPTPVPASTSTPAAVKAGRPGKQRKQRTFTAPNALPKA